MTSAATSSMWSRSSMSSAWVTSAIVATRRSGTALQPADLVRRVVVEVLLATDLVPVGLGELRVVRVPLRLGVHLGEDLTGREGDGVAVDVSPTADVHHLVEALTDLEGLDEVVNVGGGGHVYRDAIALATGQILTEVHAEPEGDTHYPEFAESDWHEIRREEHLDNDPPYEVRWLERRP